MDFSAVAFTILEHTTGGPEAQIGSGLCQSAEAKRSQVQVRVSAFPDKHFVLINSSNARLDKWEQIPITVTVFVQQISLELCWCTNQLKMWPKASKQRYYVNVDLSLLWV